MNKEHKFTLRTTSYRLAYLPVGIGDICQLLKQVSKPFFQIHFHVYSLLGKTEMKVFSGEGSDGAGWDYPKTPLQINTEEYEGMKFYDKFFGQVFNK